MAAFELMSPVKRDRLRKQAKLQLKKDMRETLPVLTKDEIRRARIPYHEAVFYELDEQGYASTYEFLKQLIQFQEDQRNNSRPDSVIALRPQLIYSKDQFDILYKGLRNAEIAHYKDDIGTECSELIMLGAHFGMGSQDWWWLGEQLLIQADNVTSQYSKDGGKREATCKYIYGKFILENLEDIYEAKEKLVKARSLSTGQLWHAKKELGPTQECIFIETCLLIYKVLILEAKEIMLEDPLKAARICSIARKRALDACDHLRESEALMLQGICEMKGEEAHNAIKSFLKVLQIHLKFDNVLGICEARIHLSLAYLKINEKSESRIHLEILLELAEENNLPYFIAQAYRFLGEYYLKQNIPEEATPMLIKSLKIFHELEDAPNREQARNLAAISAGQELMHRYVNLMLKSGRKGPEGSDYFNKLMRWKDMRELFWDEFDDLISEESASTQSELMHIEELDYGEEEFGEGHIFDDAPTGIFEKLEPIPADSVEILHFTATHENLSQLSSGADDEE